MSSRLIANGRIAVSSNRFDSMLPSYIRRDRDERKPLDNAHAHQLLREAGALSADEARQLHKSFAESAWEDAIARGIVPHGPTCSCRSCASKEAKTLKKDMDPRTPFRDGLPFRDAHEDVVYRVLENLAPMDGWAPSEFWQDRYRIDHKDVIRLVQQGFMDAAVAKFSDLRRYRVRDERFLKESKTFKSVLESVRKRRAKMLAKSEAAATVWRK